MRYIVIIKIKKEEEIEKEEMRRVMTRMIKEKKDIFKAKHDIMSRGQVKVVTNNGSGQGIFK